MTENSRKVQLTRHSHEPLIAVYGIEHMPAKKVGLLAKIDGYDRPRKGAQ